MRQVLTSGGLVCSRGGWAVIQSLRKVNVHLKSDERILGDIDVRCGWKAELLRNRLWKGLRMGPIYMRSIWILRQLSKVAFPMTSLRWMAFCFKRTT